MTRVGIKVIKEELGGHKAWFICDLDGNIIRKFGAGYKTKKALIARFHESNDGEYVLDKNHIFKVDRYFEARPWLVKECFHYRF